ncbi:hypothetical protein D3C76_855480 [compost metagenome]
MSQISGKEQTSNLKQLKNNPARRAEIGFKHIQSMAFFTDVLQGRIDLANFNLLQTMSTGNRNHFHGFRHFTGHLFYVASNITVALRHFRSEKTHKKDRYWSHKYEKQGYDPAVIQRKSDYDN